MRGLWAHDSPSPDGSVFVQSLVCYVVELEDKQIALSYPDPRGTKQNVIALVDSSSIVAASIVVSAVTNLPSGDDQGDTASAAQSA